MNIPRLDLSVTSSPTTRPRRDSGTTSPSAAPGLLRSMTAMGMTPDGVGGSAAIKARSMVRAPVTCTLPSASRFRVASPEAVAVIASFSISWKPFRPTRNVLTPSRNRLIRPPPDSVPRSPPLIRPPRPSVAEKRLTSMALSASTARTDRSTSLRPIWPSSNAPFASSAAPDNLGSAREPAIVPFMSTTPETVRSPPTSRSHRGLTSPLAAKTPFIGWRLATASLSGAAEATTGRVTLALERRPPALLATASTKRAWSLSVALTRPSTDTARPAPRARAPSRVTSIEPLSRAP